MRAATSQPFGLVLVAGALFALIVTGVTAEGSGASKDQPPASAKKEFDWSALRLSVWHWKSGGELTLFANGAARHTEWLRNGSWQILDSGTMVLTHPNGLNFFVNFKDEENALIVSANGGQTAIKLKE